MEKEVSLEGLADRHPELRELLDDIEIVEAIEEESEGSSRLQSIADNVWVGLVLGIVLFIACSWLPHYAPSLFPPISEQAEAAVEQVSNQSPEAKRPILGP